MVRGILTGLILAATLGVSVAGAIDAKPNVLPEQANLSDTVRDIKMPKIKSPKWLKDQQAAAKVQPQQSQATGSRHVTYSVSTKGRTSSDLNTFKARANQTLNDSRGWARMGLSFQEVPSGGDFNLVLSQASLLPSFSNGCSADWSCRVGTMVIINDDRWSGGTVAWNSAGGGIRDYQHMVINHEVGHWLGHGHASCPKAGAKAPVMQQQSISLQGCKFNPWPLESELY